jgi:hypothetical protein
MSADTTDLADSSTNTNMLLDQHGCHYRHPQRRVALCRRAVVVDVPARQQPAGGLDVVDQHHRPVGIVEQVK